MMKLSVVVPAYNEERFLGTLLEKIRAVDLAPLGLGIEIIVVDDCSSDRTGSIAAAVPDVVLLRHERNHGKGMAVRTGLARSHGEYVVIQDADLEYDPNDYLPMLRALLEGDAHAVYGSRYLGSGERGRLANWWSARHPDQSWAAYLGGRSLSLVALACTGRYLSDTVTALKLFRGEVIRSLDLRTTGFETDHEITAKLLARGCRIREVPIHYFPRTRAEGKKIGLRDWGVGARTFLAYRNG